MVLVRPEDIQRSNPVEGQIQLTSSINVKTPKRVLHFSDGVLEEYSSDEEDLVQDSRREQAIINPASLTWGPWIWYRAWSAGSSALSAVDTVGEFLASFFGITTPRYYFELLEYKRREEEKLRQQEEVKGWSQPAATSVSVPLNEVKSSPLSVDV
nr:protein FAM177A1 [Leptinotarsa decemlineata]